MAFGQYFRQYPESLRLDQPAEEEETHHAMLKPFLLTGTNQLWRVEFKGYLSTGDGNRCDPTRLGIQGAVLAAVAKCPLHYDEEHAWVDLEKFLQLVLEHSDMQAQA